MCPRAGVSLLLFALPLLAHPLRALPLPAQLADKLTKEQRLELVELQPEIDAAIDKGVAWLLERQLRDGSWGYEGRWYATGQTALCAYTLLKAGLPASHSAVQRALASVAEQRPPMVYAASCQLLALAESGDPSYREHMERIVDDLIDLQKGSWGYPNPNDTHGYMGHLHTDRDLSITQFALLGLRAAAQVGIDVPSRVWLRAADAVVDYQEKPQKIGAEVRKGRTGSGRREIAGFRYQWSARHKPSGSMTTAGVAALAIAREQLGKKLRRNTARAVEQALDRGVAWLGHHYDVQANPNGGREWQYYYLYGLERVGALLDLAYFEQHPWYLDGARELVRLQKPEGNWERRRHPEPDTCFAILFLKRATAPVTGKASRDPRIAVAEEPEHEIGMRARGGDDGSALDVWVTRIGKPDADGKPAPAPPIERVEYLIDGAVAATVPGDPSRAWRGEGYHARHTFRRNGSYRVSARVHVVYPPDDADGTPTRAVLRAGELQLEVAHVLEPWMLEAARAPGANQLDRADVTAEASSASDDHAAPLAVDGMETSSWRCAPDDAAPELRLELFRPVRANTIVLHQLGGSRVDAGHFDRITRVRVRINKRSSPYEIEVAPDASSLAPLRLDLPSRQTIRRIEITIFAREPGDRHRGVAGFNEILALR